MISVDEAGELGEVDAADAIERVRAWERQMAMPLATSYAADTAVKSSLEKRRSEGWSEEVAEAYRNGFVVGLQGHKVVLIEQPVQGGRDPMEGWFMWDLRRNEHPKVADGSKPIVAANPESGWRPRSGN